MLADRNFVQERISRLVDVLVAGFTLVVLSPLMLLIAAAVALECGWPVFYAQWRSGQGKRPFRIYKFRKFHVSNEAPGPLVTVRTDPRISRVGALLERTKLDELPQFYNVLKGDMALVGPRPDNGVAEDRFTGQYRSLLDYKPGIFGPGQVAFRNASALYPDDVHPHDFYREHILPLKAALDLSYYPRRTLLMDLAWIVRGGLAVIGLHKAVRSLPAPISAGKRSAAGDGCQDLSPAAVSPAAAASGRARAGLRDDGETSRDRPPARGEPEGGDSGVCAYIRCQETV